MLIDLQLHSTYSDGNLTPTQIVKFISKFGIKAASLTDHNTVGGLSEFKSTCQKYNIKPIPGLELYTAFQNKKFNLLWFNFDKDSPDLHSLLRSSQIKRRAKARIALKKLANIGFKLDINKILDSRNHYVPINYLVAEIKKDPRNKKKIIKELGHDNLREEEIMEHYLLNRKICHLSEVYIKLETILELRKKIGGLIILNHPGKNGGFDRRSLMDLKKAGIDGIEVLSPHHSLGAVLYYQHMANEYGLIMSGGSDFHMEEGGKNIIKNSWQYYKVDAKLLAGAGKIIGKI